MQKCRLAVPVHDLAHRRRRLCREPCEPRRQCHRLPTFEYSLSGKWLELLKEIAPSVTRVAVLRDAAIPSGTGQWGAIQSVAPSFGMELRAIDVHDAGEIERTIRAFARTPNTGMILTASAFAQLHRKVIITLADRHKLPAAFNAV